MSDRRTADRAGGSNTNRRRSKLIIPAAIATAACIFGLACADNREVVTLAAGMDEAGGTFFTPNDVGTNADAEVASPKAMCVSTVCPPHFATCLLDDALHDNTPPPYRCGTDLRNDIHNCGACGNDCGDQRRLNVQMACLDGVCRADCTNGRLDCNGIIDDGCEVNPQNDPNNCGACGNRCASGVSCVQGVCGCPAGTTDCNGTCIDLDSDDDNCGACGYNCDRHPWPDAGAPPSHMRFGCAHGACAEFHCDKRVSPWENCNGLLVDGCEVDLGKDADNCGLCGSKCAPGQRCFDDIRRNTGIACQCPAGLAFCGEGNAGSCIDLESDSQNCGSCGFVCPNPFVFDPSSSSYYDDFDHGHTTCNRGRCGYACAVGFADCNGRLEDGCEATLANDPRNCGACGVSCDNAAGQPCVNGQCVTAECDAGTGPQ